MFLMIMFLLAVGLAIFCAIALFNDFDEKLCQTLLKAAGNDIHVEDVHMPNVIWLICSVVYIVWFLLFH